MLVVVFTLVQAPTLPLAGPAAAARRTASSTRDVDVESSPLASWAPTCCRSRSAQDSRLHGVEVFELRLPQGANVTLVVRDGEGFVPGPRTVLRRGDSCSS